MTRQFAKSLPFVSAFCYLGGCHRDWFFLRYEKKTSPECQKVYQKGKGADSAPGFRSISSGEINSGPV